MRAENTEKTKGQDQGLPKQLARSNWRKLPGDVEQKKIDDNFLEMDPWRLTGS